METLNLAQAQEKLTTFYSGLYRDAREKHDSPDKSRVTIARRIARHLRTGLSINNVLNVGSGPQSVEQQMLSSYYDDRKLFKGYNFYTIDIAAIRARDLLANKRGNVHHARSNALDLPFANKSVGLLFSNHAIDFLPGNEQAFAEAYRVLSEEGVAIFNLHHPNLIPDNLEMVKDPMVQSYWTFLRQEGILIDSAKSVVKKIEAFGFKVNEILLNSDRTDKWWEVVARK